MECCYLLVAKPDEDRQVFEIGIQCSDTVLHPSGSRKPLIPFQRDTHEKTLSFQKTPIVKVTF